MPTVTKKDKFFEVLRNIFVGAKIEGSSGYVNLMQIKSKYYNEFKDQLLEDIDAELNKVGRKFEEEMYNKLFTFFKKYFSESGSIYFSYTPLQEKIYERIYRDDKDVMLFWKTHMLFYVKTEQIFKNLEIEDEDILFLFNVAELQHKKNNEKKELVFEFVKAEHSDRRRIHFSVKYSTHGSKTNTEEILKNIKKEKAFGSTTYKQIEKVLGIFKRQSEVDYFINKNAKEFLREQFNLWIKGYLLDDETLFESARLQQLKAFQRITFNIIDLVSQFEDELVKVWNKPKFVHSANYVLSLKTLKNIINFKNYKNILKNVVKTIENKIEYRRDIESILREIYKLPLQKIYVNEIKYNDSHFRLNYVKFFKTNEKRKTYANNNNLKIKDNISIFDNGKEIKGFPINFSRDTLVKEVSIENLYIDTKYFDIDFNKQLIEIISEKNNLSEIIDGYIIKSENYQALNTLINKYSNKVDLVYIDPPFNTEGIGFSFIDNYKDSTWLSMLENRINKIKPLLKSDASFYLHLDHNCNYLARLLINNISPDSVRREIIWNTSPSPSGLKSVAPNWIRQHDTIFYITNKEKPKFNKLWRIKNTLIEDEESDENDYIEENIEPVNIEPNNIGWLDVYSDNDKYFIKKYNANGELINVEINKPNLIAIGDVWNDIYSMMYTQNMTRENWGESNTQKPENLLRRIIQSSTNEGDLVIDFYLGTGTTISAAHKLKRKWIGIEMGDYIDTVVLKRMKTVVVGDIKPKLTVDTEWKGGGIFKYFSLEQYEEALGKAKYEDKNALPKKDIYHQYVFLKDLKLADDVIKLEEKSKSIKVDLTLLHPNIDIPETLSHLMGKFIKQIKNEEIVFTDGTSIDITNIDYKIIKPLIWW